MTLLVLKSFDDFLRLDFFLIGFRYFFVTNRAEVAGPQLLETDFVLARGRIDSHRYIHEPEGDASFPDRTHTKRKAPEAFTFNTYLAGQDWAGLYSGHLVCSIRATNPSGSLVHPPP